MFQEKIVRKKTFLTKEVCIFVIDIWDTHWCKFYEEENSNLAKKTSQFLDEARKNNMLIFHLPGDRMDPEDPEQLLKEYKNSVARKNTLSITEGIPPSDLKKIKYDFLKSTKSAFHNKLQAVNTARFRQSRPRPSSKGCFCQEICKRPTPRPWTKQHPLIQIDSRDHLSSKIEEVVSVLKENKIKKILYVGGALNFCVLDRDYGIRRMHDFGFDCSFVKDHVLIHGQAITPEGYIMTNSQAHELQSEHVERNFCSSVVSSDITQFSTQEKIDLLETQAEVFLCDEIKRIKWVQVHTDLPTRKKYADKERRGDG